MAVTSSPLLAADRDGAVLTLTLNRPDVLNSLNDDLLDDLNSALNEAAGDESLRAIVLTGAGRGFCSGQDLRPGLGATGQLDVRGHLREHYVPAITAIRTIEKPVIAAVNGVAAGAGMSLALAADFRIAGESSTFTQAFVRIGLVPDSGSSYFLPRLVGTAKALELAMLGDLVDAEEALRVGIVNRVVPDDQLIEAAAELAARLGRGPRSLGLVKRLFNASHDNGLAEQLSLEEDAQVEAASSEDFVEGVTAFVEKRPPRFTGR